LLLQVFLAATGAGQATAMVRPTSVPSHCRYTQRRDPPIERQRRSLSYRQSSPKPPLS
jgi:hypothetical protein